MRDTRFYPGSGPPMEVIPYILLDYIDDIRVTEFDLPRDRIAKTLDEFSPLQPKTLRLI